MTKSPLTNQSLNNTSLNNTRIKSLLSVFSLCLVVLFTFIIALKLGAASITFSDIYHILFSEKNDVVPYIHDIVWELRFPRTILAFFAGMGLALAGSILQTITRNPLADPYLFGISSGASFGVVVVMSIAGAAGFVLSIAAFGGSMIAVLLLMLVAGITRHQQVETMLLAGVALSFLFSAFTSLLLYWSDPQAVSAILFWTLGSFARADWQNLWLPICAVTVCFSLMLVFQRQLTAMLLGDESASTLGIQVKKVRLLMLLASSILTASIVSVAGGIGFVGLMVPHIVRYFISQGNRWFPLFTVLTGGIFMVWVDIVSRTLLSHQELPIGIITSAVGSLFFLSILYMRKKVS